MRKAVVRKDYVVNVIEIKSESAWKPPEGCFLVDAQYDGSPGDTWDGNNFIRPILPEIEPPRDLEAEVDILENRIGQLEKICTTTNLK